MIADWLASFPPLDGLDAAAARLLRQSARLASFPAGTVLFQEGTACQAFILVLDGSVRVQKVAESGREIVLYRVEPGQSCVLTTACLLSHADYSAEAVAETALRAVLLPNGVFQELLARSAPFRDFVFAAYATRLAGLLLLIEEVAFGRIDMRLAQWLIDGADPGGIVRQTHHQVAIELGTAREVVSRQLKEFERRGWVTLQRGRIALTEPAALLRLAQKQR